MKNFTPIATVISLLATLGLLLHACSITSHSLFSCLEKAIAAIR
jgi:hypothetical protein